MRKPWSDREVEAFLGAINPIIAKWEFRATRTKVGGGPTIGDHVLQVDLTPSGDANMRQRTSKMLRLLRSMWGGVAEILKNGPYDPFEDEEEAPPQAPPRRRDGRLLGRVPEAGPGFAFPPDAPEPPRPRGVLAGYQRYVMQANGAIAVDAEAGAAPANDDVNPLYEAAALGQPVPGDAQFIANYWAVGDESAKPAKKPSYRFKYAFHRPDGGTVYTAVY